jgi:dsDNA-binding SOS-regulon protein
MRGIQNGRFPNAKQDDSNKWVIPVDDLIAADLKPRKTWIDDIVKNKNETGHDISHDTAKLVQASKKGVTADLYHENNDIGHDTVILESKLAIERERVENLKLLLEAEKEHVRTLKKAMLMIEPSKTKREEAEEFETSKTLNEKQSFWKRIFKNS